ncbi:MAG TPA: hypothetical protein VM638_01500, partial [Actinomycetota bacterium]|nr:hypothetical protein [Actinomycetota bacterium]
IAEEAAKLVEVVAAQDLAELIKGFEQERGQEDKAIEGIAPTLRALAMAQVEVLLVDRTLGDERTAWFGPEAAHLSQRRDDVEGLGAAWVHEGPLVDACIRSALLSGARVAVVPPEAGIRDGLGALLRWST